MTEHSPTQWRVKQNSELSNWLVIRPDKTVVCAAWREADAAFIVEAVNGVEADAKFIIEACNHYEGVKRDLAKQIAQRDKLYKELGTLNEVATNLQRSRAALIEDNNHLRDLVRRMIPSVEASLAVSEAEGEALDRWLTLLREAREALGEEVPE